MTKHELMTQFTNELHKRHIADAADVAEEYEQHFAFKMADGYSEEEIAAKLGDPVLLAAQFGETGASKQKGGSKPFVVAGLCIVDLFAGLAASLLGGTNIYSLIPSMPYWCGAILALAFAALTVLSVIGCIYYGAFLRQLVRSFGRFQHNALASSSGEATLPALAINPQFSAKTKRRLRSVALIALALFAACFVLSYVVCSLSAGSLEFWHTWGWFLN